MNESERIALPSSVPNVVESMIAVEKVVVIVKRNNVAKGNRELQAPGCSKGVSLWESCNEENGKEESEGRELAESLRRGRVEHDENNMKNTKKT